MPTAGKTVRKKTGAKKASGPAKSFVGELQVKGFIRLDQFWPNVQLGASQGSDADTVVAGVDLNSFRFRPNPSAAWQKTRVFEGATVRKKKVLRGGSAQSPGDPADPPRLSVRLQWVDSPELHYPFIKKDVPSGGVEYRQPFGETATVALLAMLKQRGGNALTLQVTLKTRVDSPNDVFDANGRLIGDVIVHFPDGTSEDINLWLAKNGWAFPTYYNTITAAEKAKFDAAFDEARRKRRGFWKYDVTNTASPVPFNSNRRFRSGTGTAPGEPKDPTYLPKLFRRSAGMFVEKQAGKVPQAMTLPDYVARAKDRYTPAADFMAGKTKTKSLATAFQGNRFTPAPEDVIFVEKTATLKDANGAKVVKW